MITLIIYADILIIVNSLVDYFLLLLTFKLTENKVKSIRLVFSAFLGGLSSIYIFFPNNNTLINIIFKTTICSLMSLISIGFPNIKQFIKFSLTLFTVSIIYGGIFHALVNVFNISGLFIKNGITYFNISPIFLCVTTAFYYVIAIILSKIFKPSSFFAENCEIFVTCEEKTLNLKGIIDTGNSATDIFGKSEIIITDTKSFNEIFENDTENMNLFSRLRLVPCATVSGEDVLKGYRCDSAIIKTKTKTKEIEKPILAKAKINLNDGYNAIINPKTLM